MIYIKKVYKNILVYTEQEITFQTNGFEEKLIFIWVFLWSDVSIVRLHIVRNSCTLLLCFHFSLSREKKQPIKYCEYLIFSSKLFEVLIISFYQTSYLLCGSFFLIYWVCSSLIVMCLGVSVFLFINRKSLF